MAGVVSVGGVVVVMDAVIGPASVDGVMIIGATVVVVCDSLAGVLEVLVVVTIFEASMFRS